MHVPETYSEYVVIKTDFRRVMRPNSLHWLFCAYVIGQQAYFTIDS